MYLSEPHVSENNSILDTYFFFFSEHSCYDGIYHSQMQRANVSVPAATPLAFEIFIKRWTRCMMGLFALYHFTWFSYKFN